MTPEPEITPLSPTDRFRFACGETVPCFNACCRDLNQFLTPYDILRLKRNLSMTSREFLTAYVAIHAGPQTGLPVAAFRETAGDHPCPFVDASGCRVYPDRPSSCRIYPIARMISRSRETGEITAHYALLKEAHCRGFEEGREWRVAEWLANQGVDPYNEMNDRLLEIIALKNRRHPGPLPHDARRAFQTALYDLDAFRDLLFGKGLDLGFDPDPGRLDAAKTDDEALLRIGLRYVRETLLATEEKGRGAAG
jgi:hypothetical protein